MLALTASRCLFALAAGGRVVCLLACFHVACIQDDCMLPLKTTEVRASECEHKGK